MAEKTLPFLVPTYYKQFNCTGSACEDNCCQGWSKVYVTKNDYDKIKNVRRKNIDKEFLDKLSCIVRIKHNVETLDIVKNLEYARISFDKDTNWCPLITEDKLCSMYKHLGEEYLSRTCKIFPRLINVYNNGFEAGLSASCVEVVRKAIYNEDGIDFEYIDIPESQYKICASSVNFKEDNHPNTYKRHFTCIRNFMIDILQCRIYSMDERMIILGIFCQKAHNSEIDEIPSIIDTYKNLLESGAFLEHINTLETVPTIKDTIIDVIVSKFKNIANDFMLVRDMRADVIEGIELNGGTVDYKNFEPFMKENSYMLENYMVNHIFTSLDLFIKLDSIWDVYISQALIYTYLKYVLASALTKYKTFSEQQLTNLFVAIDKTLAHNPDIVIAIEQSLSSADIYNLASMVTIIKN